MTSKPDLVKELRPCPFCGSEDVRVIARTHYCSAVYCEDCCAEGPYRANSEAAEAWNTRAASALSEARGETSEPVRGEQRTIEAARALVAAPNNMDVRTAFARAAFNYDIVAGVIVALADKAGRP